MFAVQLKRYPRPVPRRHYRRAHLRAERERLDRAAARYLKRPDPRDRSRAYVEGGKLYWPARRAAYLANVTSGKLHQYRAGCRWLEDRRPIDWIERPVSARLEPATGEPKVIALYADEDLNTIWIRRHGTKGRRRSRPTGKKRGQQPVGDPAADAAFAAAYAAAKAADRTITVPRFAGMQTPPITVKEAQRRLGRHRARLSKAAAR